ncbi:hypothetical protein ACOMHN_028592 [Nucella lapillus]
MGDKIVDLSPLGNKNHTARFSGMDGIYPYDFSWNPCQDFSQGGCRGVAGCQPVVYSSQYHSLGAQSSARFLRAEDGLLRLRYTAEQDRSGFTRSLYVTLTCVTPEEGDKVTVVGERPLERGVYDMTLYIRYACLRPLEPEGPMVLSVGIILLVSMAGLVAVYVVSGALFQRFVRKAQGLEVLPHVAFWTGLPGMVKDGFLFVKKRGRVDQMYKAVS